MKKWILLGLVFIVLSASAVTVYMLSQPSGKMFTDEEREARLEEMLGRDVRLTNTTPRGNAVYDGNKITFEYPAKAQVYEYRETSTTAKSSALDDFSFDMRDPRIIFNLKVSPTNATTLSDYPAVRLREQRGEYLKTESKLDTATGFIFSKEDEPEISAFYLYQGNMYSISLSGSSYEHLMSLFDSVTASAKLK